MAVFGIHNYAPEKLSRLLAKASLDENATWLRTSQQRGEWVVSVACENVTRLKAAAQSAGVALDPVSGSTAYFSIHNYSPEKLSRLLASAGTPDQSWLDSILGKSPEPATWIRTSQQGREWIVSVACENVTRLKAAAQSAGVALDPVSGSTSVVRTTTEKTIVIFGLLPVVM